MCTKLEYYLNKRIKKLETRDMMRRKIKQDENEDRLFDFIKCREIKKWNEMEKNRNEPNTSKPNISVPKCSAIRNLKQTFQKESPVVLTDLDAQHL